MGFLRRSSSHRILAIDIGSSAIKLLVVQGQHPAPVSVLDFRVVHLPSTGKPFNISELPAVLSGLAHELNARAASVRAAISGRHAIIRIVDMPKSSRDELQRAMTFQVSRHVPIPPDEITFDCTPLPSLPAREGWQKVLLVALRRSVVEQHTHALRAAGLEPLLLDVEPVALLNAFSAVGAAVDRSSGVARDPRGSFCLLHCGSAHLDLCIVRDGMPLACRMLEPGDADLLRDIASSLRVELPDALASVLRGIQPSADTQACFERFIGRVAGELRSSFDYFRREFDFACECIYLTGGLADRPGVPELVNRATHLPVRRFDPFLNVNLAALDHRAGSLRAQAAAFVPAVGLAVRSLALP